MNDGKPLNKFMKSTENLNQTTSFST